MSANTPSAQPSASTLSPHETTQHLTATAKALKGVTDRAGTDPSADPRAEQRLHAPAQHEKTHSWLNGLFPHAAASLTSYENAWHLGNYVVLRDSGEKIWEDMSVYVRLGMHLLYYGSEQAVVLHWQKTRALLRDQSVKMGLQYDAPESKAHILPFITSFKLEKTLDELKEPDPSKYKNFNEFFSRELKPGVRPVAEPGNDLVVSSPADCRLTVFPTTDSATKYWIKGFGFTLSRLLGSDELAQQFSGGSLAIARLAPQDYHRWHSPVSGTVHAIREIPGTYYTVNPQAITQASSLDVFCENRRSVMTLKRTATGAPTVLVAVGAMLVGSIKYNPGIQEGAQVQRGECLGAFQYGGSTVIALFPPGEVTLDQDLVQNSTEKVCETLVQVGWRIGVSQG